MDVLVDYWTECLIVAESFDISGTFHSYSHFFSDYFQNRAFLAVFETFLKNGINRIGKKVYF